MGQAFEEKKKKKFICFSLLKKINMGNLFSRNANESKGNKRTLDSEDSFDSTNKRGRFDQEPTIIIKESDVGIVAYVNPHLKGFHSILKYR